MRTQFPTTAGRNLNPRLPSLAEAAEILERGISISSVRGVEDAPDFPNTLKFSSPDGSTILVVGLALPAITAASWQVPMRATLQVLVRDDDPANELGRAVATLTAPVLRLEYAAECSLAKDVDRPSTRFRLATTKREALEALKNEAELRKAFDDVAKAGS